LTVRVAKRTLLLPDMKRQEEMTFTAGARFKTDSFITSPAFKNPRTRIIITDFDKREGQNMRKATAFIIIPLNVAHSACETSQIAYKILNMHKLIC
jgi:hypothetical protein